MIKIVQINLNTQSCLDSLNLIQISLTDYSYLKEPLTIIGEELSKEAD